MRRIRTRLRAGGASAAAAPPSANLLAWWKKSVGITSSGGVVSSWADQSGNGHDVTQATASKKPVLLGDGTIQFASSATTQTTLNAAFSTVNQPVTICARIKATASLASPLLGSLGGSGAAFYPNGTLQIYAGSALVGGQSYSVGTWLSIVAVFDGANSLTQTAGGTVTGNPGTGGLNSGFSMNEAYFFGGSDFIASDVIVYSAALDATDRASVLTYLDTV